VEARAEIDAAEDFLHLAPDELGETWLNGLHPRATSLLGEYRAGESRDAIYERIVERILEPVRAGRRVVAAFYGHPGVYVTPSHEAIRRAREEGHDARMLPAISAEDCLFADLGFDPAASGCASHDATEFLLRRREVDTSSALILWQICVIGDHTAVAEPRYDNLAVLVERLAEHYPREHEVVLYEASPYPIAGPVIERLTIAELAGARPTPLATLYIPPATVRAADPELAGRLGLSAH